MSSYSMCSAGIVCPLVSIITALPEPCGYPAATKSLNEERTKLNGGTAEKAEERSGDYCP